MNRAKFFSLLSGAPIAAMMSKKAKPKIDLGSIKECHAKNGETVLLAWDFEDELYMYYPIKGPKGQVWHRAAIYDHLGKRFV